MPTPADTRLQVLAARIAVDRRVDAEEALALRREVFPDGVVTRAEAEALLRLNAAVTSDSPEWRDAFVEALVDHALAAETPAGHLGDATARWLEDAIVADGIVERETEIALLVKLMEKAESTPEPFAAFVRDRLFQSLTSPPPAALKAEDVALIRRLVFSYGGEGSIAVTREEADWLFAIDSATDGAAHDPSWPDLFVKAICNHLMAQNAPVLLARLPAMQRDAVVTGKRPGPFARWSAAFKGGPSAVLDRIKHPSAADAIDAYYLDRLGQASNAEVLTLSEITWVVARSREDARITANERAVLEELRRIEREQGHAPGL